MQAEKNVADAENHVKAMIISRLRDAKEMLHGHRVVLFGSRAHGIARPRSDFDIGIYGQEPLPLGAFYKLEDMMEELPTLYKIDLVDLNRATKKFREKALERAEILYE